MVETKEIAWPTRPAPLDRADGIRWHITVTARNDGGLILYCNLKAFCVLRRVGVTGDTWFVPGHGTAPSKLAAVQQAGLQFLGTESRYETLVSV